MTLPLRRLNLWATCSPVFFSDGESPSLRRPWKSKEVNSRIITLEQTFPPSHRAGLPEVGYPVRRKAAGRRA
jgi:hypothetical protein